MTFHPAISLLLVAIGSSYVKPQDRWRIAAQSLTETIAVDTSTITNSDGTRTAWVKKTPFVPKDSTPPRIASTSTAWSFRCSRRQFAVLQVIEYDAGGRIVDSFDSATPFNSVVPESLSEIIFDSVCQGRWRKTLAERFQAQVDSMALDLWQSRVRDLCPNKKISDQQIAKAFRVTPVRTRIDSIDVRSREICRRAPSVL